MTFLKYAKSYFWLGFMLLYLVAALWPASFWYEPGRMAISDSTVGQPVEILYQGGANRDFIGGYTVVMRDFETQGIVCEARGGPFPYRPESKRPVPLTMEWWAPSDRRCHRPPVGDYLTETCWKISGLLWGIIPPKHNCTEPVSHSVRPAQNEG